jgi:hypothetical protein
MSRPDLTRCVSDTSNESALAKRNSLYKGPVLGPYIHVNREPNLDTKLDSGTTYCTKLCCYLFLSAMVDTVIPTQA